MSVLRVFFVDFNDPKLTALVPWYDDLPAKGDLVVLTDGECDFALGQVAKADHAPDREQRKPGHIHCKADYSTWLDGDVVLSLARAYAEQQTRGAVNVTVRFGTANSQGRPE